MTAKSVGVTLILILISLIFSVIYIAYTGNYIPTFVKTTTPRQVVIDAGHGGEDGGAVVGNICEKDINLKIARILKELLDISGFETIMTRDEDVSIYDEGSKNLRRKKRSDIVNRLEIANKNPNSIFVSIHQNKFPQTKYWGAQVFYGLKDENSKSLAENIQNNIIYMIQPENKRNIKPICGDVYLIKNATVPAVLCECGFMSNAKEMTLLLSPEYQKKMAFSIYIGILQFYNC